MAREKKKAPVLSDDDVRRIMLRYFYDRNKNATSRRGKKTGAAAPISVIRADLKVSHGLKAQQVQSNLTYLLSQGWVEDQPISKSFKTGAGGIVPATTNYFIITAVGIDKIGGPSEFTRDRFHGIRIEATGQNIITLGDGNQINARFREIGEALSELRQRVKQSDELSESDKVDLVVDIDSIQDQLAKPSPNKTVIKSLWEGIKETASIAGLVEIIAKTTSFIDKIV